MGSFGVGGRRVAHRGGVGGEKQGGVGAAVLRWQCCGGAADRPSPVAASPPGGQWRGMRPAPWRGMVWVLPPVVGCWRPKVVKAVRSGRG
ncbi:hypothetical protein SSP35_07_01470 [Streptomyces sp. NBRC 110611]|nr:hypothetical protein SSP35_07_01470 [Streptomyces sp. NBRC 110611]